MESPSNPDFSPIASVRPVAPYIGGKRNLAKRLVERILALPHKTYAEPFIGMGGVFFRRTAAPSAEVINDYSRDVANLFRILQRHYVQFMDTIKFGITTRAEFERLIAVNPDTLTDLERAARFLYLQRTAFGGKVSGRNFGVQIGQGARFDITKLAPMLEDIHTRLSGVVIECLDFEAFIRRYDRPETLFYLDPPYHGSESDYGRALFTRDDFARLEKVLRGLSGRFLMSINDTPEIRAIFSDFVIEEVKTTYSVGLKAGEKGGAAELIVSNLAA